MNLYLQLSSDLHKTNSYEELNLLGETVPQESTL